jgi:thiamine-phosphate pyrophosphorylase
MAYPVARRLLGPGMIIGISVGSEAEAREAAGWDADYVGIAPAFATATKPDAGAALGVDETARLARSPAIAPCDRRHDATNAAPLYAAGLEGVAVMSAICAAADPSWPRATSPARCTRIAAGSARRRIPVWRCRRFLGPLVRAWGCGFG